MIYKATNNINGKCYIGQTVQAFEKRKDKHIWEAKNGSDTHFHRALSKHGFDNFYWTILNECDDIDLLNQLEQYYIKCYESMNREFGYNLQSGGKNCSLSNITKQRMSKAALGKPKSKEHIENSRKARLGMLPSIEARKNMGIAQKKRFKNKENHPMWGLRGGDNPNYDRKNTPAVIGKMRQTALNRPPMTEKTKKKMSKALMGKKKSKEHCENISIGRKKWVAEQKKATA